MSSFFKGLKQTVRKCDLFCTTEFLRYDQEPQYCTYTGAITSILMVITFIGIFTNSAIQTLSKNQIIWSQDVVEETVKPFTFTATSQGLNKWMFAVGINGLNFNGPQREFDVTAVQTNQVNGTKTFDQIPLIPCAIDNWSINSQAISVYKRFKLHNFLCPKPGQSFELEGKFTSQVFKYVDIKLSKCNSSLDTSRPCSNDTNKIQYLNNTGGYYYLDFFFINTLINPSSNQYISYYLQDRNYLQFTEQVGGIINLFFSKYSIQTDQSITPIQDKHSETGTFTSNIGQVINYQNSGNQLARIVLRRSSTEIICKRSYSKIDETMSYIGGLFGSIMTVMLLMRFYTQMSFQIEVGDHLYEYQTDTSVESKQFNIFYYFGYVFYLFCKQLGCKIQWNLMEKYDNCRQEIQNQFDVKLLFERMILLQRLVDIMLDTHQIATLYLCKKLTLKQAQFMRSKFQLRQNFNSSMDQLNKTQQNLRDSSNPNNFKSNKKIMPQQIANFQQQINNKNEQRQNQMMVISKKHLKMLKKQSNLGNQISKKIIERVQPSILNKIKSQTNSQKADQNYEDILAVRHRIEQQVENKSETKQIKEQINSNPFIYLN